MTFAKPQIVKSPFDDNKLAIAYPYVEDGEWIHKDDLLKTIEEVENSIANVNGSFANELKKKLGL